MRRTKEQTIEFYRPDFLKGRSDDFVSKFNNKPLSQQYAQVMNWKRSIKKAQEGNEPQASLPNLLKLLKDALAELENLPNLSPKDSEKVVELGNALVSNAANFDKIKKQRALDELLKQEEKIQKEQDSLKRRIAELKQELI